MKKLLLFLAVMATFWASAQELTPPGLEFVCELKVTIGEFRTIGKTAHGERKIIMITGGTFAGPKLNGTVLSGGADYQYVNAEGTRTEVEAIYSIKTNDDVLIHIRNVGIVHKSPEVVKLLAEGNPIDWEQVYFRATPRFEAPMNSPYAWMNNAVFICKGVPTKDYVSIQVWQVL